MILCPYCGSPATEGDYVDNGVGMQQCSPHYCEECDAIQIGGTQEPRDDDERRTYWRKGNKK